MEDSAREHKLVMTGRREMSVSGVEDVESFDEEKVVILCSMGTLTVGGSGFKISRFNVDDGQLSIEGEIDEVQYSDRMSHEKGGSFLGKLFR